MACFGTLREWNQVSENHAASSLSESGIPGRAAGSSCVETVDILRNGQFAPPPLINDFSTTTPSTTGTHFTNRTAILSKRICLFLDNNEATRVAAVSPGVALAVVPVPSSSVQGDEWHTQFYKTKVCPYHIEGRCINGALCRFAHHPQELRPLPNLHRTKLCESYVRKERCTDPTCRFAHTPTELRTSSHSFYKVALCNFYKKGRCWNGEHCRFAHGVGELQHPTAADLLMMAGTSNMMKDGHTFGTGAPDSKLTKADSIASLADVPTHSFPFAVSNPHRPIQQTTMNEKSLVRGNTFHSFTINTGAFSSTSSATLSSKLLETDELPSRSTKAPTGNGGNIEKTVDFGSSSWQQSQLRHMSSKVGGTGMPNHSASISNQVKTTTGHQLPSSRRAPGDISTKVDSASIFTTTSSSGFTKHYPGPSQRTTALATGFVDVSSLFENSNGIPNSDHSDASNVAGIIDSRGSTTPLRASVEASSGLLVPGEQSFLPTPTEISAMPTNKLPIQENVIEGADHSVGNAQHALYEMDYPKIDSAFLLNEQKDLGNLCWQHKAADQGEECREFQDRTFAPASEAAVAMLIKALLHKPVISERLDGSLNSQIETLQGFIPAPIPQKGGAHTVTNPIAAALRIHPELSGDTFEKISEASSPQPQSAKHMSETPNTAVAEPRKISEAFPLAKVQEDLPHQNASNVSVRLFQDTRISSVSQASGAGMDKTESLFVSEDEGKTSTQCDDLASRARKRHFLKKKLVESNVYDILSNPSRKQTDSSLENRQVEFIQDSMTESGGISSATYSSTAAIRGEPNQLNEAKWKCLLDTLATTDATECHTIINAWTGTFTAVDNIFPFQNAEFGPFNNSSGAWQPSETENHESDASIKPASHNVLTVSLDNLVNFKGTTSSQRKTALPGLVCKLETIVQASEALECHGESPVPEKWKHCDRNEERCKGICISSNAAKLNESEVFDMNDGYKGLVVSEGCGSAPAEEILSNDGIAPDVGIPNDKDLI